MLNFDDYHLVGLLSPGPDFFLCQSSFSDEFSSRSHWWRDWDYHGVLIWATAAVLGLAIIFASMPIIQGIVMMLGGAYLVYLGIKMAKVKNNAVFDEKQNANVPNQSTLTSIMKGLLVNLSNAKVVIYFSSVMSLVLVNITETSQILTALAVITVETFLYFYIISVLFSRSVAKQFYSQYSRYIDNAAGLIFIFFGIYLIYSGVQHAFNLIKKRTKHDIKNCDRRCRRKNGASINSSCT